MQKRVNRVVAGGEFRPAWVVSSGSILLDAHLNPGGYPSGSIIQYMSAAEGSFKTSFALKGLGLIQDLGHPVGFVDAEHALDTLWAANMGVVINDQKWFMSRPYTAEEAFDDAIEMIAKHGCRGVVIDSIDACQPASLVDSGEDAKSIEDATIGAHAKAITRGVRKLLPVIEEHQAIVFAINQMKVNLTQMGARGNNPTGGKGLQFYSRFNLEMNRGGNSENLGKDIIPIRMRILRSKLGRSFEDVHTYAVQGGTIDENLELVELAKDKRLITKSGSWWKTADKQTIGQGLEDAAAWCKQNKSLIL